MLLHNSDDGAVRNRTIVAPQRGGNDRPDERLRTPVRPPRRRCWYEGQPDSRPAEKKIIHVRRFARRKSAQRTVMASMHAAARKHARSGSRGGSVATKLAVLLCPARFARTVSEKGQRGPQTALALSLFGLIFNNSSGVRLTPCSAHILSVNRNACSFLWQP